MNLQSSGSLQAADGRLVTLAVVLVALLVVFKALYLAFFVTPLWDIPDEIGHLAYVMQLAAGNGLPVLGKAMIPGEVMAHVKQVAGAAASGNWIAQHPPLYYYVAAVPYWIAQQFTSDIEVLYRAPRVVAALCSGLLVIVLYRTGRLTGLSDRAALCMAGCVAWLPMVSHLSSGTNHDVPLLLVSALAAHYLARFVLQRQLRDAYVAALWLSVAGMIKMTAWILLPPFAALVAWELRGPLRQWCAHLVGISVTALFGASLWMLRSIHEYGSPLYTALSDATWSLSQPMERSFAEFLGGQPVFEHFLLNFYGLIGWIGSGAGEVHWFQVAGFPRILFSFVLMLVAAVLLFHFIPILRGARQEDSQRFADACIVQRLRASFFGTHQGAIIAAVLAAFTLAIMVFVMKGGVGMNLRLFAIALILGVGGAACFAVLLEGARRQRLFLYGLAAFVFFSAVVLLQLYEMYLLDGRMRATHGRYFYPIFPWVLVSIALALGRSTWGERLLMIVFPLMVVAEVDAYVHQVFPFIAEAAQ